MRLSKGSRIGPYEVRGLLGVGGMGEVYRAWDPRLRRDVAIKILPAAAAGDETRLRRFEQEALAAGALNHANVVAVYDVGSHGDSPYIVSECLEGDTLRRRIDAGALTVRKAVEYAIQLAHGLAAAHARGIVHRDVKPENIFICSSDALKILDFGIAKLRSREAAADGETVTLLTAEGTTAGTVAYMSPEQVTAAPVDARADIFALGIVLYEMLCGRRPFNGATAVELQTAILREDSPPLSSARPAVPASLDRLVRRCLEKRPEDRFDTARDVALMLEAAALSTGEGATTPARPPPRAPWLAAFAGALILGAAIAVTLVERLRPAPSLPSYTQVTFRRGTITGARFAPDGASIVYSAAWDGAPSRIFTTRIGGRESRALGIDGVLLNLSSSGELAVKLRTMHAPGLLARVPLAGGAPRELLEGVVAAHWSPDGRNLAVVRMIEGRTLLEYPIGRVIYRAAGQITTLCVLPDNRVALLEHLSDRQERAVVVSLVEENGAHRILSEGWTDGTGPLAWSPSTREIYFAGWTGIGDITLNATSTSGATRTVARIPGDFALNDVDASGRVLMTRHIPRGGVLAFVPGDTQERDLSWLDFSSAVDLSADGRLLLLGEFGGGIGVQGGIGLRTTNGGDVVNLGPGAPIALSRDGRHVLATPSAWSAGDRLLVVPVGPGDRRELRHASIPLIFQAAWQPDSRRLVVAGGQDKRHARLYEWDPDSSAAPRAFTDEGEFGRPVVSPDGLRAVVSATGRPLATYPLDGGPSRVLAGAVPGDEPLRWSTDGGALFVRRGAGMTALVERLEIATGRRSPWRELRPSERAGLFGVNSVVITPDGRYYAYTFSSSVGSVYVAEGLR